MAGLPSPLSSCIVIDGASLPLLHKLVLSVRRLITLQA